MKKRSSVNRLKTLTVSLIAGANVATIILLWVCCLSTFVSPVVHPRFSQIGLLFPAILLVNAAFIIVWLLTEKKGVLLPLVGLLSCSGYIMDYCPISTSSTLPDDCIKVLSYNVCGFADNDSLNLHGLQTAQYIGESGADIICLQEYAKKSTVASIIDSLTDSLHYEFREKRGLIILSRYPFVGDTVYCTPGNASCYTLAWKIRVGEDTVTVINNHLQSDALTMTEKAEYSEALTDRDKSELKASGRIMLSKLSTAAAVRAVQIDSICAIIDRAETPYYLVCGDFNDTPISYAYQSVARRLRSAFRQSGNGLGVSFKMRGFLVRIDHIFVSPQWKTYRTRIESENDCSDHYPIVTYISKQSK